MSWSPWALDAARSAQIPQKWCIYRAEVFQGQYTGIYDQKEVSKREFPDSDQLIQLLNSQTQSEPSPSHWIGEQHAENLTISFQNLGITPSSPAGSASSNPFLNQPTAQSTGYDLFVSQRNNPSGYSAQPTAAPNPFRTHATQSHTQRSGGRAHVPVVGHPANGSYASSHQQVDRDASRFLAPSQVSHGQGAQNHDRHGNRRSQTPAVGRSQPQQYAMSLRRPQSAQDRGSSRLEHTSSSRSGSNMRGMKVQRQKDWRSFFKLGRVFKAVWTQTAEDNNAFSETLRFLVIRPLKHSSICLPIHTYGNKGTTARHARPRQHLVIYSGDTQPDLVDGESEVVLERPPVRVILDPKAEALRPASRLALSKLHTVEHNIPVALIGKIAPRDVERVRQYSAEALGVVAPMDAGSLDDLAEEDEEGEGECIDFGRTPLVHGIETNSADREQLKLRQNVNSKKPNQA